MIPTQEAPNSADIRLEPFPEFATAGTKTPPSQAKYPLGYVPSDTFPAENANYLFNKSSRGVTQINMGLLSVEKELNYLLSQSGCTSCISDNTQVYNAMMYKINAAFSCAAPTAHASSETTYGVGNADCYGHLKISDTYDCVLADCQGVAASQYALATAFACLSACGGAPINDTVTPLNACQLSGVIGTSPYAARADHIHGFPTHTRLLYKDLTRKCVAGQGGSCYFYYWQNMPGAILITNLEAWSSSSSSSASLVYPKTIPVGCNMYDFLPLYFNSSCSCKDLLACSACYYRVRAYYICVCTYNPG